MSTKQGENGTDGSPGHLSGGAGTNGGPGENAELRNQSVPAEDVLIVAGGNGGNGGKGGSSYDGAGGPGGMGGAGGAALAQYGPGAFSTTASIAAEASGGNGGKGGDGGNGGVHSESLFGSNFSVGQDGGNGAIGGAGGAAEAIVAGGSLTFDAALAGYEVKASAHGGDGGSGGSGGNSGIGSQPGGRGGTGAVGAAGSTGSASISSNAITLDGTVLRLFAAATGGDGGSAGHSGASSYFGFASGSSLGGSAGSSTASILQNVVTGSDLNERVTLEVVGALASGGRSSNSGFSLPLADGTSAITSLVLNNNNVSLMGGDDTLIVKITQVLGGVVSFGSNTFDGGAGIDTLVLDGDRAAGVTFDLRANTVTGFERIEGSEQGNAIIADNSGMAVFGLGGADELTGGAGADRLDGGAGDDTLTGGDGSDGLYGGDGNDTLSGGADFDVLDGGAGRDSMAGGTGNDHYYVDEGDTIIELAGQGSDLVYARTSFVLTAGAHVELLAAVSAIATDAIDLTGNELGNTIQGNAGANTLSGGAGNDYLSGLGGNDTLIGGDGADIMVGGTGDDIYHIDSTDRVREAVGEGYDIVYTGSSYQLSAGSEIEVLWASDVASTAAIGLVGNEFANDIRGNAGNNQLVGGAGDDTLSGLGGNDLLDGGAGLDTLIGGTGNDRYLVNAGDGDVITELAGEGNDIVYVRAKIVDPLDFDPFGSFRLAAFRFPDPDDLRTAGYTLTAGAHVELLAVADGSSTAALDLTGNELGNTIQGSAGANVLLGMGGTDYLSGLGGNDMLDGGAGRDILVGGDGADTFRVTDVSHSPLGAPDRIIDFRPGTDKIDLSGIDANTNTPSHIDEAFTFIGTNAFSGTAGELRYEVQGNGVHIYGDVDGDRVADVHIVSSLNTMYAEDFFL